MVTIKASENIETMKVRLEVSGHAEQAEYGQDIVCSAVSILTYTVAQLINEMEAHGRLAAPPTVNMYSGNAVIEAVCDGVKALGYALRIMHFAKTGYSLLQAHYPDHVKFIIDEAEALI